jgi:hypothetical protein
MGGIRDPYVLLASRLADFGNEGTCWIWTGATNDLGYGRLSHGGRQWYAHRFAYVTLRGEIPEALVLDHLCGVRSCCNPDHLEVVTLAENTRRGQPARACQSREIMDTQPRLW